MKGWSRTVEACFVLGVAVALVAVIGGCASPAALEPDAVVSEETGDWSSLRWDPKPLAEAGPSLVGWLQSSGAQPGAVVALSSVGESTVLWRQDEVATCQVQIIEVTSDGPRMVGIGFTSEPDGGPGTPLLFESDGSVEPLPIPAGFEDLVDVAFSGDDTLVLAHHVAPEGPDVALGAVGRGGEWEDLVLVGELPEYHFVESIVAIPGTEIVGIVLKTPTGPGNRDDDALVLARRDGTELRVFTTPYRDDSLPGCEALQDAHGVVFGRTWSERPDDVGAYVRATWDGSAWVETVLAPARDGVIPLEAGTVVVQQDGGRFLVRGGASGEDGRFELYEVTGTGALVPTGVDVTQVGWFAWIR